MASQKGASSMDSEIAAISIVYDALRSLDKEAQGRVLSYVTQKLGIQSPSSDPGDLADDGRAEVSTSERSRVVSAPGDDAGMPEAMEGVSPIAQRWIARSGLSVESLSSIFSIGGDEIDVIAKSVPGKSKKARLRNVFLLRGIAAYLSSGSARSSYQQVKETALHYDAFDSPNFAAHLKSLGAEVSGTKAAGYALTARGLSSATELVKEMTTS